MSILCYLYNFTIFQVFLYNEHIFEQRPKLGYILSPASNGTHVIFQRTGTISNPLSFNPRGTALLSPVQSSSCITRTVAKDVSINTTPCIVPEKRWFCVCVCRLLHPRQWRKSESSHCAKHFSWWWEKARIRRRGNLRHSLLEWFERGNSHGSRGAVHHVTDSFDIQGNSKAARPTGVGYSHSKNQSFCL